MGSKGFQWQVDLPQSWCGVIKMSTDNLSASNHSVISENQVTKPVRESVKWDNRFMPENVTVYYLFIIKYWIKQNCSVVSPGIRKTWVLMLPPPGSYVSSIVLQYYVLSLQYPPPRALWAREKPWGVWPSAWHGAGHSTGHCWLSYPCHWCVIATNIIAMFT